MAGEVELERLVIRLLGDSSDFQKMLRGAISATAEANREIQKTGSQMEDIQKTLDSINFNTFVTGVMQAGQTLKSSLTDPIVGFGREAFGAAMRMEQLKLGLLATVGSAEKMEKQLLELREIAKLPGLGLSEAVQGAQSLQSVGFEAEKAIQILREFGNVVATAGFGRSELQRILFQLGQMKGVGKVLGMDLRSILQTVPKVGQVIEEVFGTRSPEALEKMGVTAEEFINRLVDALGELPRVAGGTANTVENLTDTLFNFRVEVGNTIIGFVLPALNKLSIVVTDLTGRWKDLNPETQKMIVIAAGVVSAIGPLLVALATLGFAIKGVAVGVGFLTAALTGPVGLTVAIAAAMVALIAFSELKIQMDNIAEGVRVATSEIRKIDVMIGSMKSDNIEILEKRIIALEKVAKETGMEIANAQGNFQFWADNTIPRLSSRFQELKREIGETRMRIIALRDAQMEQKKAQDKSLERPKVDVKEMISSLRSQIDLFDASAAAIDAYKLHLSGASSEHKKTVENLHTVLEGLKKEKEARADAVRAAKEAAAEKEATEKRVALEAEAIREKFLTFSERNAEELARIKELHDKGRISIETYARALKELTKSLDPEAESVISRFLTPVERSAKELASIKKLFDEGRISAEIYGRAVRELGAEVERFSQPLQVAKKGSAEFTALLLQASQITTFKQRERIKLPRLGPPVIKGVGEEEPFGAGLAGAFDKLGVSEFSIHSKRAGDGSSGIDRIAVGVEKLVALTEGRPEVVLEPVDL